MKYYEIWFYCYGDEDERTDYGKEFTFYFKTADPILTDKDMVNHLRSAFPKTIEFHCDTTNYVDPKHFSHMSKWFEVSPEEFEDGCGIAA